MTLPSSIALRRIYGRATADNSQAFSVEGGVVTVSAVPSELRYTPPGGGDSVNVTTKNWRATVVNGYWEIAGVIPWDTPGLDAGVTGAWSYKVQRSWAPLRDKYVVVPAGSTALDVSALLVPQAVGQVAIVVGPKGTQGRSIVSVDSSTSPATIHYDDGTTGTITLPAGPRGTSIASVTDDDGDGIATIMFTDGSTAVVPLPRGPKGLDSTVPGPAGPGNATDPDVAAQVASGPQTAAALAAQAIGVAQTLDPASAALYVDATIGRNGTLAQGIKPDGTVHQPKAQIDKLTVGSITGYTPPPPTGPQLQAQGVGAIDPTVSSAYLDATTDRQGFITEAVRADGSKYLPRARVDALDVGKVTGIPVDAVEVSGNGYAKATVDSAGRLAEDALDETGRTPDWVLNRWRSRTAVLAATTADTRPIDLVIHAGQSNAFPSEPLPSDIARPTVDARVLEWQVPYASLSTSGTIVPLVETMAGPYTEYMGAEFDREYAQRWLAADRRVMGVQAAVGGTGFTTSGQNPPPAGHRFNGTVDGNGVSSGGATWDVSLQASEPAASWLPGKLVATAQAALAAAPPGSRIVAMTWAQGEADSTTDIDRAGYATKVDQLFSYVRTQLGLPRLRILVAGLQPDAGFTTDMQEVEDALRDTPTRITECAYEPSQGGYVDFDHPIHFGTPGQYAKGRALAVAYDRARFNWPGVDPFAPALITTRRTGRTVLVSWSHPPTRVQAYKLQYRVDGGAWTDVTLSDPTVLSATLPVAVDPTSTCGVRMATTNAVGTGSWTKEIPA